VLGDSVEKQLHNGM